MSRKNLLLISFVLSGSFIIANAGEYSDIQKRNTSAENKRQEIQNLLNEGQALIQKIDQLITRRFYLDKKQLREVMSFIHSTQTQITKEKQYQQIAKQRCKSTGLQEHCKISETHTATIAMLKKRLIILERTKQNIIRKKKPLYFSK